MTNLSYDVIVIGGGHNGLTAAAYLARDGLRVAVLERNSFLGGGTHTQELTLPGFKHDTCSTVHGHIQINPLISKDELGLISKYGLKYVYPEAFVSAPFLDGKGLVLYSDPEKTRKSLQKFSKHDAEAYVKFFEWCKRVIPYITPANVLPPPPLGVLAEELDRTAEGQELLRVLLMSASDVLDEWFEDDRLKGLICKTITEIMVNPGQNGTGIFAPYMIYRGSMQAYALPIGGSGALAEKLALYLKDHGTDIVTNCFVKKVTIKDGIAKAVEASDGRVFEAKKAVVADVNIKQVPGLVGEENLEPEFVRKIQRIKHSRHTGIMVHLALNEAPKYRGGEDGVDSALMVEIVPNLENLSKRLDDIKYGKMPTAESACPLMVCATLWDQSRAPVGKHTLYFHENAPYELKPGGAAKWDEIKEETADTMLEKLREFTTNMGPENILKRAVESPVDLERRNISFVRADQHHISPELPQYMSLRPIPGLGFKLPVQNLYLCGPSSPSGGGVTGGGRVAALVLLQDLGLREIE